jgi:hypothetical protein
MARKSLFLAVAVVSLIVWVFTRASARRHRQYLPGVWVGDKSFLEEAGLSELMLFLSPEEDGECDGYLLMVGQDEGGDVFDGKVKVRRGAACPFAAIKAAGSASGTATWRGTEIEFGGAGGPMPSELSLTLSMPESTLTLHDGEKIFALLVKDPGVTKEAISAFSR